MTEHSVENIQVLLADSGTLLKADLSPETNPWRPLLILIPIRLGVETLNPLYIPGIKQALASSYCTGIAGGKNRSSYYILGYQGDQLLCLDPHTVQPALDSVNDYMTCHTTDYLQLSFGELDPSLLVAFLLPTPAACTQFLQEYAQVSCLVSLYIPLLFIGMCLIVL